MRTFKTLVAVALLPALAQAQGEPAAEEEASPWSGKASFGFLGTSGNTENSNLNANFEVSYTAAKWKHLLDAYAINASEDDDTTAEAYGLGWKSERNLTDHDFLFGQLSYRKDRFSGFPEQFAQSVGYGRRLIDTEAHSLNAEIGAGARQSERADGEDQNDFIASGAIRYKWTFSETADFTQEVMIEHGEENTYLESVSAVRARLIGALALVASFTVKNNSDVPVGTEDTDTYTALSVEYSF